MGMWILIGLVVFVVGIAVGLSRRQSQHWFCCANCHCCFQVRWMMLLFSEHAFRDLLLTCPHCGHRGYCRDVDNRAFDRNIAYRSICSVCSSGADGADVKTL